MKLITPKNDIFEFGMLGGQEYLTTDQGAGYALIASPCSVENKTPGPFFYSAIPINGKVCFVRDGGFGDILFLTPVIHQIKIDRPDIEVFVSTYPRYFDAIINNPDVDGLISFPPTLESVRGFDQVLWLEGAIEESKTKHAVDVIADLAGVSVLDKRYRFNLPDYLKDWSRQKYPRTGKQRVGVQVYASTKTRTYPDTQLRHVIYPLAQMGYEVFLFGERGAMNIEPAENIIDLSLEDPGLTFIQACSILSTCDAAITPDSSLCHVAAALQIPTVALFAAFPSDTRTKYSPTVKVLEVSGGCAPCYYHHNGIAPFPSNGPCSRSKFCNALASIPPEQIIDEVTRMMLH